MTPLPDKDPLTLLITDSGLGGLSVCAGIVAGLERTRPRREVALTYFNAWPEPERGYNLLPGTAERVRVFDRALLGMARFEPDLLVIACNTLSALYPHTAFSRAGRIPVLGIIEFGVRMLAGQLQARPDSLAVLFGTPATLASGAHAQALAALGVPAERVLAQPCDRLAGQIELDPDSPRVRELIDTYVGQAAQRTGARGRPILAALCCTHYGYSLAAFERALAAHFPGTATILDPNRAMTGHLVPDRAPRHREIRVKLEVVSRIPWSGAKLTRPPATCSWCMRQAVLRISGRMGWRSLYRQDRTWCFRCTIRRTARRIRIKPALGWCSRRRHRSSA